MFSPVSSTEDSDLEVVMSPAIQVEISSIASGKTVSVTVEGVLLQELLANSDNVAMREKQRKGHKREQSL